MQIKRTQRPRGQLDYTTKEVGRTYKFIVGAYEVISYVWEDFNHNYKRAQLIKKDDRIIFHASNATKLITTKKAAENLVEFYESLFNSV